jgi:hypothetical protein
MSYLCARTQRQHVHVRMLMSKFKLRSTLNDVNFNFLFYVNMASKSRQPLPTLKVQTLRVRRSKSLDSTNLKRTRDDDRLDQRLVNIRSHLLHDLKHQIRVSTEPTLVFDQFLYIGGLKSLNNQVCRMNKIVTCPFDLHV